MLARARVQQHPLKRESGPVEANRTLPQGSRRRRALCWLLVLVGVWTCAIRGADVRASDTLGQRGVPSQGYFAAFGHFYEGDYKDALDTFLAEGRSAIKTTQSRWIDSICYHTMAGECYYHMGDLPKALEHYNGALTLYCRFSDWFLRVQFPAALRPAGRGSYRVVPWGASTRGAVLAQVPDSMLMSQGKLDNQTPFKQGGLVQMPVLISVQVQEIVRCTALAIRRRSELMGPVGPLDPLTTEVLNKLAARPGPPNHWSEAWIDVQLGLAMAAAGRDQQAVMMLQRGVVAAGQFDHPLTPMALQALGYLALKQGAYADASKYFLEATYAGAHFGQWDVVEEAFYYGSITHMVTSRQGMYPPVGPAIQYCRSRAGRRIVAGLCLMAGENAATIGQTVEAARWLDEAKRAVGQRTMKSGWIGARSNFIHALVAYQQKRIADGDAFVKTAMAYMRGGSHWLFQISLADGMYTSGSSGMTSRMAMDLYKTVLREPENSDWAGNPMESLAVLVTPQFGPLERWFEVALDRKDYEGALAIGDRIRRHRFFSSLSFGGRLQALRWILGAPSAMLDQNAMLQRQDLLSRYPGYAQLEDQVQQIRKALTAKPLVAENADQFREQKQALDQMAALCLQQETLLREIAVRREGALMVFPPLRATAEVQKSLPNGHAVLVFQATSRQLYAFLLNNQRYAYWQIATSSNIYGKIVELLRTWGLYEQNAELSIKDLTDARWKAPAKQILDLLTKGSQADFSQPFEELIVVPDGALWYLPFEALQVNVDRQSVSLLSRFRIRYAPTFGLVMSDPRGRKPSSTTAVAVGQLFAKESEPASQAAFERLAKALPGTVALRNPLPAVSSIYGSLFDRLVVFDDVGGSDSPYGWTPLPLDRGKPGSALNDWLPLPWPAPEEVVLPGFHTPAENVLKRVTPSTAGNDVFLAACGMMASGSRTIMLSRWRTGGQTAYDFSREFALELPHSPPAEAYRRAVALTLDSVVNLDAEPRVKRTADAAEFKATHPFFWAGYMLIDASGGGRKPDVPAGPAGGPGGPPVVGVPAGIPAGGMVPGGGQPQPGAPEPVPNAGADMPKPPAEAAPAAANPPADPAPPDAGAKNKGSRSTPTKKTPTKKTTTR